MNRTQRIQQLLQQTNTKSEKELQEYLKVQYYTNIPIISDTEYDELFSDKDYIGYNITQLIDQNGPWKVLEHKIAMGSLDKLKTWDQAENWLKGKNKVLWEPKLDGLSIELVYEFGKLTHAILRGGGDKGEDILKNAKNFQYVLQTIDTTIQYVSVRGEVVISQSSFNQLRQTSEADYSNRRNCVPGICRRYDGRYSDFLSFWAYDIYEETELEVRSFLTELEKLSTLHNYGFKVPSAYNAMSENMYKDFASIRDTAEEFQMDGLVIKTMDMQHQIALKFEPNGETTKILDYTWDVGSTGKLVPVVHFEKVNVGGTNLTKASVGSYRAYIELCAAPGSIVKVRKMNDVIPKVTEVITQATDTVTYPDRCPICGESVEIIGADLYCVNKKCPVKLEGKCTAVYWAASLKGVTDKWVKELVRLNKIQKPSDVLTVKAEDIASIDGYSLNKANKIIEHLYSEYAYAYNSDNILFVLKSLSIPNIGGKALDKLAEFINTIDRFNYYLSELSDDCPVLKLDLISSLGNSKGTKAYEYFKENREDIISLINTIRIISLECSNNN